MKLKRVSFIILVICFLSSNIYFLNGIAKASIKSVEEFSISGEITDGIYNMYVKENINLAVINPSTTNYTFNKTFTMANHSMDLTAIKINMANFYDKQYKVMTTDNITNPKFAVSTSTLNAEQARLAQYFKLDNFSLLQNVKIFLNYSIVGLAFGFFQVDVFDANDLAGGPINQNTHSTWKLGGSLVDWLQINFNEYLGSGEYFLVFTSWDSGGSGALMNNNSWQIHEYNSSLQDKGESLFENASGWYSIPDDGNADFIMNITLTPYCSPEEINLTTIINGEVVEFSHDKDDSVRAYNLFKPVWQSKLLYYLENIPARDYNVSFQTNRSIEGCSIDIRPRYVYFEKTNGTFFANSSITRWTVDYKKVNASSSLLVFFKFPNDWTSSKFFDSNGNEIVEYGLYFSYVFGEHGNAILYNEDNEENQTFEYTATFTSPNYVSNIKVMKKQIFTDQYDPASYLYIGDSFKIQANIKNSDNELISNGTCIFYLHDPNGNKVAEHNKTNIDNGLVVSNEFNTNGWSIGTYSIVLFWTNGQEIGLQIYSISVQSSPWLWTILITIIVAAAIIFSFTYLRRVIRERNWIKSLNYLLILNKKSGTPMYNYSFGSRIKDSALISGMITAISDFVKDTTGSKKQLRVIDQEDKKVILTHGEFSTIAILAEKDLQIIHNKSKDFLSEFEEKYAEKVESWDGETSVFKGVNKIVEKYFPISMEDKLIHRIGNELDVLKERVQTAKENEEIKEILNESNRLTEQYHDLILKNYNSQLIEIIKMANRRLASEKENE